MHDFILEAANINIHGALEYLGSQSGPRLELIHVGNETQIPHILWSRGVDHGNVPWTLGLRNHESLRLK